MQIKIITPAPLTLRNGNSVTALRYARILRRLGHQVNVGCSYDGSRCDLLIALHAYRSADSIKRFAEEHPRSPSILVLTGTDLYHYLKINRVTIDSLERATSIIVLQQLALADLPKRFRNKTRVIYQSSDKLKRPVQPPASYFKISLVANLRPEKDPFRAALAVRLLPESSRARVIHAGRALSGEMGEFAKRESDTNPRYRWLGELPHWRARRLLAGSHAVVVTSRIEGGSNVLCEALASSVPVIASKIPALIGTLGPDYPGYFPVGNTRALSRLIAELESNRQFYRELKSRCSSLSRLVAPAREREAWRRLISELTRS